MRISSVSPSPNVNVIKAGETMEKPTYGIKHERNAEIIEHVRGHPGETRWSWVHGYTKVKDDTGATHNLQSMDYYPVGTKGIIQYITSPGRGEWYFKKIDPNRI